MGLQNLLCYQVKTLFYYINTSEIPGKLSLVNMISSQVKVTGYFTCENNMLLPLLWLNIIP